MLGIGVNRILYLCILVLCVWCEVHTGSGIRFPSNLQREERIEFDTSITEFPRSKMSWNSQLYSFIWTVCLEFVNNLTKLDLPGSRQVLSAFQSFLFPFAKVKAFGTQLICFKC